MPSLPAPLPMASFREDQVVYIAENEQDTEFLASQLDCQVVFQRRCDLESPLSITLRSLNTKTSETLQASQTFGASETFETLEAFRPPKHLDVSL